MEIEFDTSVSLVLTHFDRKWLRTQLARAVRAYHNRKKTRTQRVSMV